MRMLSPPSFERTLRVVRGLMALPVHYPLGRALGLPRAHRVAFPDDVPLSGAPPELDLEGALEGAGPSLPMPIPPPAPTPKESHQR